MTMENKDFKCTGDCLKCSPIQRQYCSSQIAYNNLKMLERLEARLDEMSAKLKEDMEVSLINPVSDIAQEGDGAEE